MRPLVFSILVLSGLNILAQNSKATTTTASSATKKTSAAATTTPTATEINWMTWEQAQAANAKSPRKFVVDVYTDWCGWCKRMDATTFHDPNIVAYVNKNYYAVKFNAERNEVIKFDGKDYKFVDNGGRGYHELAYQLLQGQFSYPTTVYLNEKLELLSPVPGYLDPKSFDQVIHYFGDGNYLKTDWANFQKTYTSPVFK